MDTVSIFSLIDTLASATRACWAVGSALYEFSKEVKEVDESMKKFFDEVRGLQRALDVVTVSLRKIAFLPTWVESRDDKEIWTVFNGSVDECDKYLKKLVDLLSQIQGNEGAEGWLPSTVRTFRLRTSKGELESYPICIFGYKENLQFALTVVNL